MHKNYKIGLLIGVLLIAIAIAIGIFLQNDIAFIFGGIGVIIIGITILLKINRKDQKDAQK